MNAAKHQTDKLARSSLNIQPSIYTTLTHRQNQTLRHKNKKARYPEIAGFSAVRKSA